MSMLETPASVHSVCRGRTELSVGPEGATARFALRLRLDHREMARSKLLPPPPPPSSASSFRDVERFWKARRGPPLLAHALDPDAIVWSAESAVGNPRRGEWTNLGTGEVVECWRVSLKELGPSGMGQRAWKGKARADGERFEGDWGIVFTAMPGQSTGFECDSEASN